MAKAFDKDRNYELVKRVQGKYGFELSLPKEFAWAKEDGDFLWLRKETKDFGLGILVNVMLYRDEHQFDTQTFQPILWNALPLGNTAIGPNSSSIANNLLYFAILSVLDIEPVLICPVFKATARSAIVVSSDSPER